jgi:hypothetical protein
LKAFKRISSIALLFIMILLIYSEFNKVYSSTILDNSVKLRINPLAKDTGLFPDKINIFINESSMPKLGKIYKIKHYNIPIERVKKLTESLDIRGNIKDLNKYYSVKDNVSELFIDKNKNFQRYIKNSSKGSIPDFPAESRLQDEDYIRIAKDFLNKNGLSRTDMVFASVTPNISKEAAKKYKSKIPEYPFMEVHFSSIPIEGTTFLGDGPLINIWISKFGEVWGYEYFWRELDYFNDCSLISLQQALKQIHLEKGVVQNDTMSTEADITSVELVLLHDPPEFYQEYVIPHFLFKGKTKDGGEFSVLLRAISEKYYEESSIQNLPSDLYR